MYGIGDAPLSQVVITTDAHSQAIGDASLLAKHSAIRKGERGWPTSIQASSSAASRRRTYG